MAKKSRLPFFHGLILGLNFLACLPLLISYLSPVIDPQTCWPIAFFGLAYPLLLAANLVFILIWVLMKSWYALLSLACICIGWGVLNNNIGLRMPSEDTAKPGANVIHMMTYNVHNFKRYGSKNDISTKHDILEIIQNEKPDIIGFQEFYSRKQGEYDMQDSLVKIMGTDHYFFVPIIYNQSEAIGVAIFSKFPILGHGMIQLSEKNSENACIYIDVKKGNKAFRIYSVHLQSIRFESEDYKYINSITKKGPATDGSSARRLGSKLKSAFVKRSLQVFKIKEHAATCPYPYIISGDFNDTPSSYAVNQMAKGLKNAFHEKGSGLGRTYNGSFPNYQIDYIMASQQFDVAGYEIIEKKLSDHYPVRSDLVLK